MSHVAIVAVCLGCYFIPWAICVVIFIRESAKIKLKKNEEPRFDPADLGIALLWPVLLLFGAVLGVGWCCKQLFTKIFRRIGPGIYKKLIAGVKANQ